MKENKKKIMGFILTLVMFIGCLSLKPIATYAEGDVAINETNFPDEIFRWYVSWYDKNKDGTLSQKELDKVQKMDLSFYNFYTYRELDIKNLKGIEYFKNLKELRCINNSNLTSLDLSKNTALTELICIGTKLTSLDLSNNTALTKLDCYENQLRSLDLGENKVLTELDCHRNQLTSLNLSKNTALTELNCYNNQLTNINLSENTALTKLNCDRNQLPSLDLSKNTSLTELNCDRNQLTGLDLSGNADLTILYCCENQLTSLDVSKNTALIKLICFNNQLTNLNLGDNTALTKLICDNNQLISLDLSKNTNLDELECSNNKITKLDLSKNTVLINLYCKNNRLTSLDVSNNAALKLLVCSNNKLINLDVSKNTALNLLICNNDNLTKLDLKNNINLGGLYCSENQLANLDLSQNAYLQQLECHSNYLTNLNLSNNTRLYYLVGKNNPLTYVKLPEKNPDEDSDEGIEKELSPVTYTVKVAEGSSKIPFTALPQGFDKKRIKADSVDGTSLDEDGFTWDKLTNPIKFKYKLWDKPEKNDAELREADDEESRFEYAVLRVLILEVVGPVDPNKVPNPNPDKYWTVKFGSEDPSKGTVAVENTFYVLKTANKTLADLASTAPEVTAKTGFKFTGWNPALDANTSINGNLTVNATFEEVTPTPAPIEYKRDHTPSIPVIVNVAKTMKLNVKLIIGSKEMIKSVDGVEERIMMDVAPFIENGRTMLPIRFVAEALGFNVRWDKDSRTVILIDKENVVKIPVDTNKIIVNEKEYTSDVKPVIKNDRTMLPIANIARALGLKDGKDIHWNENTKEVIITREIAK
ncbi:stalk domain-containing protein [Peptoniphilus vaginalis]|uniref:stalk domain-containing protein n=1 Tax=Peptoniphilus vaginalis TaxID=1756987 RepID=UPI0023F61C94|nr:stalk domain-containing protein [Peptoniphilus vaginalis]